MGYRGRLIHKFQCEVYRLDATATSAVVGGGYDNDFKEPKKVTNPSGAPQGLPSRREATPILLSCQVEGNEFKATQRTPDGDNPRTGYSLVLHFRDLEARGMVDSHGTVLLRKGDRVSRILDVFGNECINFGDGLFIDKLEPDGTGLGLARSRRNLLVVTLANRDKGAMP